MWVELGVWHDIRRLEEAAERFETHTYPRVRAAFGSEWTPGIDGDPHIHILHATGLGENVLGYTSSLDEYPSEAYPLSNEAEMMLINVDNTDIGSSAYHALLARQLQRLVQWNQDRNEERWLREGLADLAVSLSGLDASELERAYVKKSDTRLTHWNAEESQRGAAYLFATYFHQRFGDHGTQVLTSEPANGIRGIEATLEKLDADITFDDLFADWLTANYLDSASEVHDSLHSYAGIDLERPASAAVHETYPVETETAVQQFGADYIVLRGDLDLQIEFTGTRQASSLSVSPYSGRRAWWSNRADESLTTLTRKIDLSGVDEATLIYRLWYDIEPHHDYAAVAVRASDDEGWRILHTPSGTDADPYGNSPGWSYTGRSDGWLHEEVSLSDYAGEEISVRFSYLTDGTITREGVLLDDVSVPEIGYVDDIETNLDEWRAQGFLPIDTFVPQPYLALLIERGEKTMVERLPVEEDQTAEWVVPLNSQQLREAVLVISGLAPLASEPAPYQLKINP
jgi:immune inhibitor A